MIPHINQKDLSMTNEPTQEPLVKSEAVVQDPADLYGHHQGGMDQKKDPASRNERAIETTRKPTCVSIKKEDCQDACDNKPDETFVEETRNKHDTKEPQAPQESSETKDMPQTLPPPQPVHEQDTDTSFVVDRKPVPVKSEPETKIASNTAPIDLPIPKKKPRNAPPVAANKSNKKRPRSANNQHPQAKVHQPNQPSATTTFSSPFNDVPVQKTLNDSFKFFIANVSFETTAPELKSFFSQHGKVNFAKLIYSKDQQQLPPNVKRKSRGFGFVYMLDEPSCEQLKQFLIQSDPIHKCKISLGTRKNVHLEYQPGANPPSRNASLTNQPIGPTQYSIPGPPPPRVSQLGMPQHAPHVAVIPPPPPPRHLQPQTLQSPPPHQPYSVPPTQQPHYSAPSPNQYQPQYQVPPQAQLNQYPPQSQPNQFQAQPYYASQQLPQQPPAQPYGPQPQYTQQAPQTLPTVYQQPHAQVPLQQYPEYQQNNQAYSAQSFGQAQQQSLMVPYATQQQPQQQYGIGYSVQPQDSQHQQQAQYNYQTIQQPGFNSQFQQHPQPAYQDPSQQPPVFYGQQQSYQQPQPQVTYGGYGQDQHMVAQQTQYQQQQPQDNAYQGLGSFSGQAQVNKGAGPSAQGW